MKCPLSPLLLLLLATTTSLALAHGDDNEHATVIEGDATYTELHMAQEHHMDSFDLQSFFHLHDLNRDGILDVNELESIYGVHHEKAKKGSSSVEVHTAKAKEIVQEVLNKLDTDRDGYLTMREFVAGGVGGLPNFKGVEHLGHHYDAEGEYFLHHEEKYHNTPETQGEESYIHPEDIEHFMAHDQIEKEENERVLEFQGVSSDNKDSIHSPDREPVKMDILMDNSEKDIEKEHQRLLAKQGAQAGSAPGGQIPIVAPRRKKIPTSGEIPTPGQPSTGSAGSGTGEKSVPVEGSATNKHDADAKDVSPEEKKRRERAEFARAQAQKFGRDAKEAGRRGEWGTAGDEGGQFGRPKDGADRLRKNVPYKFKMKKSFWGEF
ncbi:BZ3500_MvSof-1268-A1-R1_Chr6-2g08424 [Microbotryum saponariae]|uniref:BZ3500_MvSof-1268-A1-R1_Chr6-2g08424 protein n=1 Tax=Microbotryum saponariae TaxID=289078 RepID=A0A2X0LB51_9BASI|nr:BZ3500_MvSof-1268-A1-R1_Chr6-2g08424 [Microbotryum saponariae]SDA07701.1 BZ3501_MvSof-1269-A2-R1_Chr6-1g08138 [Microbotryum saponariae]